MLTPLGNLLLAHYHPEFMEEFTVERRKTPRPYSDKLKEIYRQTMIEDIEEHKT